MKAHLLYPDRDLDLGKPLPWNAAALTQDLGLDVLFAAMAGDDEFVLDVSRRTFLSSAEEDAQTIGYRQAVLKDCLKHPDVPRMLYDLCVEVAYQERKAWFIGGTREHPGWLLYDSLRSMELFLRHLRSLRDIADSRADEFTAEGWTAFFATLRRELDDEYLGRVADHVERMQFERGVLFSAKLDGDNRGTDYVLHEVHGRRPRPWDVVTDWVTRPFAGRADGYRFTLDPRDESGSRALRELRDRAIADVAYAVARAAEHIRSFFTMLRRELAFYVGCVNLFDALSRIGEPWCFGTSLPPDRGMLAFRGLYDPCLALRTSEHAVGSDVNADGRDLVIVTGPNQGGKSTFLRSVGVAQLMMQAGLFVPAESFAASTRDGIFTHFTREEDVRMEHGKLDEELNRMSEIVDHLTRHPMVLFNESFAATNEREGAEIARQVVSALLEIDAKMLYVTHQYEFAHGFAALNMPNVSFLRAERMADGVRTFRVVEGEPQRTSFAEDLYRRVFPF